MATQARIDLRGSLSHTAPASAGGRTLKRGSPVVITDPAHIQYYRNQGGISVTYLSKAKAKVQPEAEPEQPEDLTPKKHSEADLNKMNKGQLFQVATLLGLDLDKTASNADIRTAILEAQNDLLDEDDGEDK